MYHILAGLATRNLRKVANSIGWFATGVPLRAHAASEASSWPFQENRFVTPKGLS